METKRPFAHLKDLLYTMKLNRSQQIIFYVISQSLYTSSYIWLYVYLPPHCLPHKCHLCSTTLCLDCSPFLLPPRVCHISCNNNLVCGTTFGKCDKICVLVFSTMCSESVFQPTRHTFTSILLLSDQNQQNKANIVT